MSETVVERHGIIPPLLPLAVPIETLDTHGANPRRGNVDVVAKSYERFGQAKSIVAVRKPDGRGEVIAGNHQLMAARQLGWTHIAVSFVDYDEATAKAFLLADNRTAELGGYDNDALLAMIRDVGADEDLLAATAWDATAISDLEALLAPPPPVPSRSLTRRPRWATWPIG